MPELPEVETVVRTLVPQVVGSAISHVDLKRRDILTPPDLHLEPLLQSRTITEIRRRGKRIIFQLDNANRFYIHLGMSGRLGLFPLSAPIAKHTHLILTLENNDERGTMNDEADKLDSRPSHHSSFILHRSLHLRFTDPRRFGGLFWLSESDLDEGNMGPEPLTLKPATLQKLLAHSKRPIKSALMDQSVIAGLGNIYVDESLFAARIHPLRRADKLKPDEIHRLTKCIKQVLRRAIHHKGSTLRDYRDANGNEGSAQNLHRIYARDGKPCLTCKTKITRIVLGGRSTCFCVKCQQR